MGILENLVLLCRGPSCNEKAEFTIQKKVEGKIKTRMMFELDSSSACIFFVLVFFRFMQ